jgi:hypothetical protein
MPNRTRMPTTTSRRAIAAAAFTALLVAAPAASAKHQPKGDPSGTSTAPAAPAPDACGYTGSSVFAPWNDKRLYTLLPDGGFEAGAAGWTLDGNAAAGEGNETFQVGDTADHQSLGLPAGSSATSPAICVAKRADVFRFFARTSGDKHSRLAVDVLYTNSRGNSHSLRVAKLRGGDAWAPTRKLGVVLGRAKGHGKTTTASVQLRFTPLGAGDWQMDDVYLDPRLRH